MASTAFLKESGWSESCAFQATYRQPHFFLSTAGDRRQFPCSRFQAPNRHHLHTCTDTHTVPCGFYEEEGLLSSTAPAVTSQMFPVITSMNCLPPCCFLSISQLHRATPQPNPGFRPDCSISTPVLSFYWVI